MRVSRASAVALVLMASFACGGADIVTPAALAPAIYTLRSLDGASSPFREAPVVGDTLVVATDVMQLLEGGVAKRWYIREIDRERGSTTLVTGAWQVQGSTVTLAGVLRVPMTGTLEGKKLILRAGGQVYSFDRP